MGYDAIIIGSGLGGLSCGAYLAKNGRTVLVLEKHGIPGGYATSYKRGDFTFDSTLHMLAGVGKGKQMYALLEACGVAEKIELVKLKDSARIIFPDHDLRLPSGDLDGVIGVLENAFPRERQGIRNLFRHMVRISKDQARMSVSKAPFLLQFAFFPLLYPSLFPVVYKTTAQLLDKHIKDVKLKAVLYANCSYYGLPPSRLNTTYGIFPNMRYWSDGAYYPRGGNQVLPDAFVDVIRHHGGEVLFNANVSEILVENGKAVGVRTESGKTYSGEAVISNTSPHVTFGKLLAGHEIGQKLVKRMERMEPSISTFSIRLGLDAKFTAKLENRKDYEIIISDTYDHDQNDQWSKKCDVEKGSFIVTLYSNIEPTAAKNGKFALGIVQAHGYEYWKKYESDYFANRKQRYNEDKERMAKILIARAERIVPDISKHIEVRDIATPLSQMRFTGNFNGASLGWANTVNQSNPLQRSPQKTPVKNLYLSSAWSFPGEGQVSVILCGYRLGRRLVGK